MKTVLITGATDGIGAETALQLAKAGWRVIVHGRYQGRCREILKRLKDETDNTQADSIYADLASLSEIRDMSRRLHDRFDHLDVLINNAGVFEPELQYTVDGLERTFAINHLAHFLLTGLALDLLRRADSARIITVSSMAHAASMDFDNLRGQKDYSGYTAYAMSKLANILFTFKLAQKLKKEPITANCLHPGVIHTKLLHAGWGMSGASVTQGAQTSVYCATSAELEQVSGAYFSDSRKTRPAAVAFNRDVQERLWKLSESLCGYSY